MCQSVAVAVVAAAVVVVAVVIVTALSSSCTHKLKSANTSEIHDNSQKATVVIKFITAYVVLEQMA